VRKAAVEAWTWISARKQDTTWFLAAHVAAFTHFAALVAAVAYDNLSAAVAKVLIGAPRVVRRAAVTHERSCSSSTPGQDGRCPGAVGTRAQVRPEDTARRTRVPTTGPRERRRTPRGARQLVRAATQEKKAARGLDATSGGGPADVSTGPRSGAYDGSRSACNVLYATKYVRSTPPTRFPGREPSATSIVGDDAGILCKYT
jgi:hypothetical protein